METIELLKNLGFSDTILERFWEKVIKTDGCWLWTGATNGVGHGHIYKGGRSGKCDYAHRISWMIHFGQIPDGLSVLHNCPGGDNPSCVRPDHLKLGTQKDNQHDMSVKGRAHKGFKLTDEMVAEIRALRAFVSGKELAARFGVSQATVSQIVHGTLHVRTLKTAATH